MVFSFFVSFAASAFGVMGIVKPIVFYFLVKALPYFKQSNVAPKDPNKAKTESESAHGQPVCATRVDDLRLLVKPVLETKTPEADLEPSSNFSMRED